MNPRFPSTSLAASLLLLAVACGGADKTPAKGAGGTDATGGTGGCCGTEPGPVAALPPTDGAGDLPTPSGTEANLRVLPWAGFTAAVSYTFDDAQPSQIEHWEELKAAGIRMTFYINTASKPSGYDAMFQEAAALGHEIGNHTVHHCRTTELGSATPGTCTAGSATVDDEIDQCSDYIATTGQVATWTFAHPYGDSGWMQPASKRFFLARGVNGGMVAPGDGATPLNLPAVAHQGDPTVPGGDAVDVFNADIDSAVTQGRWLIYLFHSILPTANNWYAGESIDAITGSIEHAKGLGSVWLDSVVNVGAYWVGQKTLEAVTPATTDGSTTWTWTLPAHFPLGHSLRVVVDGGTLTQGGDPLPWDGHGYYEVALDAGTLTWTP